MKKRILISILLVLATMLSLASCIKPRDYDDVIYVERLEILNEYEVQKENGEKYIVLQGDEKSVQLQVKVAPDNATDKKVIYSLEEDCTVATVTEDGLLTFIKDEATASVTVYIYANQNTSIKEEIDVFYIPAKI